MFRMRRDRSLIPLSHQHHNALSLCVLTDRSLGWDASDENVAKLARRIVERYEIEMRNHFELEERVLFPLCPDTSALIAEHRTMENLIELIRNSPSPKLLGDFTALLRAHIRKEENQLFEAAQSELSREKLDEIGVLLEQQAVRVCLTD